MKVSALQNSVLRRGVGLFAFTVPAAFFNLALAYVASRWLSLEAFGIYYAAVTGVNILFSPAMILNLFCTRAVAGVTAVQGAGQGRELSFRLFYLVVLWGSAIALIGVLLIELGRFAGAGYSVSVAILVLMIAYVSYCSEMGRVALQGLGRFRDLGLYSLAWMVLRFLFGAAGIHIFGTVWGGLAGILLATFGPPLALFGPKKWIEIGRRAGSTRSQAKTLSTQMAANLITFIKFSAGYTLFMVIVYADIVIAYLSFEKNDLSAYAASSVLPKGLLMLTLPAIQLVFPLLVREGDSGKSTSSFILRGLILALSAAVGGALSIFAASDYLCAGRLGFASCIGGVMNMSLVASVLLCLLRLAIAVSYAERKDWHPIVLLSGLGLGLGAAILAGSATPLELSHAFARFCTFMLAGYVLAQFLLGLAERLRRSA